MLSFALALTLVQPVNGEWPCYGRDAGGLRFSPLAAITRANVGTLENAWTARTGDLSDLVGKPSSNFEATPIMVGGTLYLSTPFSRVLALDPDTGKQKWAFDPQIPKFKPNAGEPFTSRGVSAYTDPKTGKTRIFIATYEGRLIALDGETGKVIDSFGDHGTIDLRLGVGDLQPGEYGITSPPAVVNNTVVVGSLVADDRRVDAPSGVVRAFDARTGNLLWAWDPLGPTRGAANAWAPISADATRNLVFVPTGSESPDFYGGTRKGDDRDADSIVAINATTGRKVWAFQVVHHDLWNYDIPAQPILATIQKKGKRIAVVVALTKMGFVFVLNRDTGKPVFPVVERPVPQSDVPGEVTSKTQPFPTLPKSLAPQSLSPSDVFGLSPQQKENVRRRLQPLRNEGLFTPPSLKGNLQNPGFLGGCNWSGGSYDPTTNTLYANTNHFASIATLVPRDKPVPGVSEQAGAPYSILQGWFSSSGRIPGNPPPWGTLSAVDLGTGKLKWEVPLGYMTPLAGIKGYESWGSINLGGSFVTTTGLVFIGASFDDHIRAFDSHTGKVVWQADLPAGGQATPMTYRSPKTGRQYIVICAGGHHGLGTTQGDYIVAFALPKR